MKIITKYFYPNRVEITERRTTTNEVESIKEWGKSVCARFYKTKRGEDAMSYNRITYVFPREWNKMKIKRMRFMTRREWVAKYRPERIDENTHGGILGCPGDIEKRKIRCYHDFRKCFKCWDKPVKIDGKYILVRKED